MSTDDMLWTIAIIGMMISIIFEVTMFVESRKKK